MSFFLAKPSPHLAPYIKQYWAIENILPNGTAHLQTIIPSGLTELAFHFANIPEPDKSTGHLKDKTTITGQIKHHFNLKVTGHLSIFSVTFQPQGACMFFDIPGKEISDQTIPLNFIVNQTISEIEEKLHEADSFSNKVAIIESFLISQFKKQKNPIACARIHKSLNTINRTGGMVAIDKLAFDTHLSRKQFERNFQECIGVSPKQFLKTIRFQNAIYQKQRKPETCLTSLAIDVGYYDQSHMIADFKSLSGKTPTKYFAECEAYSDYFS